MKKTVYKEMKYFYHSRSVWYATYYMFKRRRDIFFYLPTCINHVDLKMDINIQSDGTHTHKRLTLKMQGYKIV